MVQVEEGGLGALQHDLAADVERLVHEAYRVADHRGQGGRDLVEVLGGDLVGVEGRRLYTLARMAFFSRSTTSSFSGRSGVEQVLHRSPIRAALSAYVGPIPRLVCRASPCRGTAL